MLLLAAEGGAQPHYGDGQGPCCPALPYGLLDEMIDTLSTRRRRVMCVWSLGLAVLLALALVSCGGSNTRNRAQQHGTAAGAGRPSATHGPAARIPPASAVALTQPPRADLAFCRKNPLLRLACPRRIPGFGSAHGDLGYTCVDRNGHEPVGGTALVTLFASRRCVDAQWSYENGLGVPGYVGGTGRTLSAWDGRKWVPIAGESLLFSPPLHVHVLIEAWRSPPAKMGLPGAWPEGASRVTDALLNPDRAQAVSLGWVRWFGRYGQLVLAPVFPRGGEWGGHLIFHFTTGHVSYSISLHAWLAAVRLTGPGVNHIFRFQAGPALPHVIATLRAIVGSALSG